MRTVLINIAWHSSEKVLRLFTGLLVGLWIARYLGPEKYGNFNYIYAWLGLFNAIAWLGVGDTVMRDLVRDRSDENRIMGSALLVRFTGSILAVMLALATGKWIQGFDDTQMLLLAILCFGVPFAEIPAGITIWFTSHTNIKPVIIGKNITMILGATMRAGVILSGAGLIALMWTFSIEAIIGCALLIAAYQLKGMRISTWTYDIRHAFSMVVAGLPIILNALIVSINAKLDQLLLGHFSDMAAVGIYAAALRFSEIWWIIPPILMQSIAARYIYASDLGEKLTHNMARIVGAMFLISLLPCALVLMAGTQSIVPILGKSYAAAAPILVIHIWLAVLVFVDAPINQYLLATNRSRILVVKSIVLLVSNLVLAAILIPRFGPSGAALAALIAQTLVVIGIPLILTSLSDVKSIYWSALRAIPELILAGVSWAGKKISARKKRS